MTGRKDVWMSCEVKNIKYTLLRLFCLGWVKAMTRYLSGESGPGGVGYWLRMRTGLNDGLDVKHSLLP